MDFSIEPAEEAALPACFAMLPFMALPETELFVARDGEGKLLGAGAMLWQGRNDPAGFPVAIHVLPDSRRRGVGRALLAALDQRARGETARLWATGTFEEGSEAAAFAEACGFLAGKRQFHFEADAALFCKHMTSLIDRMRARGRMPADIKTIPLHEAPLREVGRLVAIQFREGPVNIQRMLEQSRGVDDADAQVSFTSSRAVMIDGVLAGALLVRWTEGMPAIVANVVAPEWRRGWVNVLLLAETTQEHVARGVKRFRFDCLEDNLDTIGLATRGEAERRKTDVTYYYAVASTP